MSNVETEIRTDVTIYDNVSVREYNSHDRDLIEAFRQLTFAEGNNSLSVEKYNPDNLDGQTWMTFVGDELASISVVERSHYTGDPDVAGRICRYHILKKYRHSNAGFRMLEHQCEWARAQGLKVLYWTHDVNNRALNALYQHKKTMPMRGGAVPYFLTETYQAFRLQPDMIFRVSQKSDLLQYVYANILEEGFVWRPDCQTIIYHQHGGDLTPDIKAEVLKQVKI
jgi:GNAT superfamily N-acetyltransferase